MFLTTYINAVDPLARSYDGFLVHSRFAPAAPLDGSSIFDELQSGAPQAVAFRPDLRVPLVTIITETDLFGGVRHGYYFARQPDNERLRVWEIPGTAHADNYTIQVAPIDTGSAPLDDIVAAYAPTNMLMGQQLEHYINFAPQHHYVVQAAIAALRHVGTHRRGRARRATHRDARSRRATARSGLQRSRPGRRQDSVGGRADRSDIRCRRLGGRENVMAAIFGSGEHFDAATVRRLYPGGLAEYLERFTAALDAAIRSGFHPARRSRRDPRNRRRDIPQRLAVSGQHVTHRGIDGAQQIGIHAGAPANQYRGVAGRRQSLGQAQTVGQLSDHRQQRQPEPRAHRRVKPCQIATFGGDLVFDTGLIEDRESRLAQRARLSKDHQR